MTVPARPSAVLAFLLHQQSWAVVVRRCPASQAPGWLPKGLVALQQALRAIVPGAERGRPDTETGLVGPGLVRSFGLDFVAMSIAWCDRALAQIDQTETNSSGDEK